MENKLIVRRLVSGILLIVLAVLSFVCSNLNANLEMLTGQDIDALVGVYRLIAIYSLVVGIFFCASCKRRPKKWIEYTIAAITIVLFILIPSTQHYSTSAYLIIFQWALIIIVAAGLPTKKGFKDMPFQNKNENSLKNATEKQLNELKEMLDDGTITQDEYDAKRKKIILGI